MNLFISILGCSNKDESKRLLSALPCDAGTHVKVMFSTLIAGSKVNMLIELHATTQVAIKSLLFEVKSHP